MNPIFLWTLRDAGRSLTLILHDRTLIRYTTDGSNADAWVQPYGSHTSARMAAIAVTESNEIAGMKLASMWAHPGSGRFDVRIVEARHLCLDNGGRGTDLMRACREIGQDILRHGTRL